MKETTFLRHIAYDSVIFGFSGDKLKILIIKYHNTGLFALPGGFVQRDENLNDAVRRGLKERTGLDNIYLEQFYTFGDVARFRPEVMRMIIESNNYSLEQYEWMLDRFISIAYYALINYNDVVPQPDALSDSCDWYAIEDLPNLMLDHAEIVNKALQTLRDNLERKLVGMNLLPMLFTMNELQKVYEAILGEKLHRGTFQRKILSLKILKRHEKQYSGAAHKAPFLYSFDSLNK
ncbi:NUDIX domain-containing protein [Emticicia sp.]|uniref:NUDIX hydrolase n=1 Tax=Emticicia sp. TaxID=1930953 RepID=UPI0037518C66